jgi:hypothetical protein
MYQRKAKFSNSSLISYSSYADDYLEENQESLKDEYKGGFKKNMKSYYEDEGDNQSTRKYPVKKPKKISKEQREVKRMYE